METHARNWDQFLGQVVVPNSPDYLGNTSARGGCDLSVQRRVRVGEAWLGPTLASDVAGRRPAVIRQVLAAGIATKPSPRPPVRLCLVHGRFGLWPRRRDVASRPRSGRRWPPRPAVRACPDQGRCGLWPRGCEVGDVAAGRDPACGPISPVVQIPVELEKLFVVLEHDLPASQKLHGIARGIATEDGELPDTAELDRLLDPTVRNGWWLFGAKYFKHARLVVWQAGPFPEIVLQPLGIATAPTLLLIGLEQLDQNRPVILVFSRLGMANDCGFRLRRMHWS